MGPALIRLVSSSEDGQVKTTQGEATGRQRQRPVMCPHEGAPRTAAATEAWGRGLGGIRPHSLRGNQPDTLI